MPLILEGEDRCKMWTNEKLSYLESVCLDRDRDYTYRRETAWHQWQSTRVQRVRSTARTFVRYDRVPVADHSRWEWRVWFFEDEHDESDQHFEEDLLIVETFQCRVSGVFLFVVFVIDDNPRHTIRPLFDQIRPTSEMFPTEENLIGSKESTGHCDDIDQSLENTWIDIREVIGLKQLIGQLRRGHLKRRCRSSSNDDDDQQIRTGLVVGKVSRRCRRRLFFGSFSAVVGLALTSRTDTPLFSVWKSFNRDRSEKKKATNILSLLRKPIGILLQLFGFTQIQLQINRKLNDRSKIFLPVDTTRVETLIGSSGRRCREGVWKILHHLMWITHDQGDEWIAFFGQKNVNLLEETKNSKLILTEMLHRGFEEFVVVHKRLNHRWGRPAGCWCSERLRLLWWCRTNGSPSNEISVTESGKTILTDFFLQSIEWPFVQPCWMIREFHDLRFRRFQQAEKQS